MTSLRLSLSGGHYLDLDDDRRVIDWSRGTYGMVLKLEGPSGPAALKLPNMSGHSDSELPWIPALLAQERLSVSRLLACVSVPTHDLLARRLASEADDCTLGEELLVCFGSASEPPRILSVAPCIAHGHSRPTPLRASGYWSNSPVDASCGERKELNSRAVGAWPDEFSGRRYYAGLPVMRYEWATGSLASALDRGVLATWRMEEYTVLFRRILSGLMLLHRASCLHGDLHVDHVMYRASASDPRSYFLSEFASINSSGPLSTPNVDGHVQVLPRVRKSALYSPLRRFREAFEVRELSIEALGSPGLDLESTHAVSGILLEQGRPIELSLRGATLLWPDLALQVLDQGSLPDPSRPKRHLCRVAERVGVRLALVPPKGRSVGNITRAGRVEVVGSRHPSEDIYATGVLAIQCLRGSGAGDDALIEFLESLNRRFGQWPPNWTEHSIEELFGHTAIGSPAQEFLRHLLNGRTWARPLLHFALCCLKEGSLGIPVTTSAEQEADLVRSGLGSTNRLMARLDRIVGL